MSIKLITSACDDVRMLREFCEYYSVLGVEQILLNVTDTVGDGKIVERCQEILNGTPHIIANVFVGQHTWTKQVELIRKAKSQHCGPEDWVLLSDLDELHDYRGNLQALLIEAEGKKENLIVGEFLDRVASNGELIEYNPERSVFEQFPVACKVSQDLLKAPRLRTIAIHGNVDFAKHFCMETDPLVQAGIANGSISVRKGDPIAIHHFKWHSRIVDRVRARFELYKSMAQAGMSDFKIFTESENLLSHLEANQGRLNLSDGSIRIVFKKDRRKDPAHELEAMGF